MRVDVPGPEGGVPLPPPPPEPRLSRPAVVGFALACLAAAIAIPGWIALLFSAGSNLANWVGEVFAVSAALGLLSLCVLIFARQAIREAHGALRGGQVAEGGLAIALGGACVTALIVMIVMIVGAGSSL